MTTAFVLSGGANLGAMQVGMLRARLTSIAPDALVGTSAGALNAAYIANRGATPRSSRSSVTSGTLERMETVPSTRPPSAPSPVCSRPCSVPGVAHAYSQTPGFRPDRDHPHPC